MSDLSSSPFLKSLCNFSKHTYTIKNFTHNFSQIFKANFFLNWCYEIPNNNNSNNNNNNNNTTMVYKFIAQSFFIHHVFNCVILRIWYNNFNLLKTFI